jgi:hypothetical protein
MSIGIGRRGNRHLDAIDRGARRGGDNGSLWRNTAAAA